MNLNKFVENIKLFNTVDEILDNGRNQSEKGFVFERLFDITIKFGFCDIFPRSRYTHLIGNANNGNLKKLENLRKYLSDQKVISGNSGGCSDITLYDNQNNTYVFITSKFPKTQDDIKKQKSVDYYDVQNILAIILENQHIYRNYKIYLIVTEKMRF